MAVLSYRQPGLTLKKGGAGAGDRQIRDLQRDLRRLGYLRRGIDGGFGEQTELAVKGLQHDLLHNRGGGSDGPPPVTLTDYNSGRVTGVSGACDQGLVACIADILDDTRFPQLPSTPNPAAENRKIVTQIAALPSSTVPIPFLMAVLTQESGLKHFNEPRAGDEDTYITVGLDTNAGEKHIITSRGYGAGQYTLFHHPPQPAEVQDFMLDVGKNLRKAITELQDKFDHFVNGHDSATQADDRLAEVGTGPLRRCKFAADDPRFLKGCRQCLLDAGAHDIKAGSTPFFEGSGGIFAPTEYYKMKDEAAYTAVPIRARIGCDWPYAVRRYNGSGINSYHYQVRVLQHLLAL